MPASDYPIWRKPQHHMDADHSSDHVHWVELFYDLIHVVTIFLLGNYLSHHHGLDGFLTFALMFTALWFAWADLSVFNSVFLCTDWQHRCTMALQIVTVMIAAASIPAITGNGWAFFALAFALNKALLAFLYMRSNRHDLESSIGNRVAWRFLIVAAIFLVSAVLPKPLAYWAFAFAVVLIQIFYMAPKFGMIAMPRFQPRVGHLMERFALLTLIVLGEGFFKLVTTLTEKGIYKVSPDVMFNFILGGVAIFVMAWIYFDFVGNAKPKDEKKWTLVIIWLAHLVLMMSGVMVGVALAGEVKVGFFEPYPIEYRAIGCFGMIGYLGALWVIQTQIDRHRTRQFADGKLRLVGIGLAFICYLVVPYVPAIIGNFFFAAALFTQIVIPLMRGYRYFEAEES
ncbi:low temperature requirement protein A [Paracoccaceae bacterium GXU_MW_L88]